jgi:hypothetical protein
LSPVSTARLTSPRRSRRAARAAQGLEPAHAALVAGAAGLDALADPHLFLGEELVEARGGLLLGLELLGLARW